MSRSGLHPRRTAVMRARADISAAIVGAIRTCDLSRAELMMILAQEMLACSGVLVAEEREGRELPSRSDQAQDCFARPVIVGEPHPFECIAEHLTGKLCCRICGGGRFHPIHQKAENR